MRQHLHRAGLGLAMFLAPAAVAQSGAEIVLVPWLGEHQAEVSGDAFFTPTEADVTGADVDLSIFESVGRFRLDPDSSYNPTFGYEFVQYEIGSSDAALPDDLTDVSFAFGGSLGDVDFGSSLGKWQVGYTLGIGYAGVTPFSDGDAYYGKADLFAVKAIDRDTRWLVGLSYDGNRLFLPDVPLPAVTYFGRLNETTTYAVGLPFSRLTWTPDDVWTIDLRSAAFLNFNGSVTYQASDRLALFVSYLRESDAFTLPTGFANRRLIFEQERVELGLTYDLGGNLALTIAGGYAFDQAFDVGFDSRDPGGLRDLDDSGYIRGGIELRF